MKPVPPSLPDKIDDATLDALARLSGISIPKASRALVAEHLTIASKMAELLLAAPVDDNHFDMAPVFSPATEKRGN